MQYLIDGHNLIARMPGLSLADPHDEVKLIQLLKRWCAADRRRKVTVVFDAGLPGGEARHLSGGGVRVVFAPGNRTADSVIIKRIEQIRDPAEHTVVSSDGAILTSAQRRRVTGVRSEQFAAILSADLAERRAGAPADRSDAPALSQAEVDEWLALFSSPESRNDEGGLSG